jgi:hypothetical protein
MKVSTVRIPKKSSGFFYLPGRGFRLALLLGLFFLAVSVLPAAARQATVAVFPLENLALGPNTPNFEVTRYLQKQISSMGYDVVLESDVISFMGSEQIRWLGHLDTARLGLAEKKLGADLVLLGTITQRISTVSPTFGLTLSLVRTKDAKTLWANTGGVSLANMQRLLGLNQPASIAELWPVLVQQVLASWPSDLDARLQQGLIYDFAKGEMPPLLQVKKLSLSPRFVQPGEQVKCSVLLADNSASAMLPQIFIKVGNRIHLAQQSTDSLFYEASWTGSEIEKGIFREVGNEALRLAATDLRPQFFEGVWMGALDDAIYPVSLILRWPDGRQQIAFVGNYTVDSTVPEIMLRIPGRKVNDLVTFKDRIEIYPTVKNREPFSRWKISVEDEKGQGVMGDEGDGDLPRKFFWKGNGFDGYPVEEGKYQLKLTGWDRANNSVQVSEYVTYKPSKPELSLDVSRVSNGLEITLDTQKKEIDIPLMYWIMEVWNEEGELLKSASGGLVPASFIIPLDLDEVNRVKINGHISLKDQIGNRVKMNISDLYLLALRKSQSPDEETTEAPEEEDDSWAWLSEN